MISERRTILGNEFRRFKGTTPIKFRIKTKESMMKKCNTISIDLAKSVFQVAIINSYGKILSNKKE